jgi:sulfatase maturation enzyme AslB (radical SAM superfamily)
MNFQPANYFEAPPDAPYRLMPLRFMRWPRNEVLVVNEVGEFAFLDSDTFAAFVGHRLARGTPAYLSLKAKHLLTDSPSSVPIDLLATKFRTKKSFLVGFTRLHLFVVTLRCDHSCPYCQVSRVTQDRLRYDMSHDTALRAIDLMFASPAPSIKVEFQGGEPLLAFDLIKFVVEEVRRRTQHDGRLVEFVIATNLSQLSDEMLEFFREQSVLISTSLDGPQFLHNANRPRRGGGSYETVVRNMRRSS